MLNTPVVLIVFNRPNTTLRVFEKIRQIQPKELFIIADGPRSGNESDLTKCSQVLDIVNNVDWDCKILTKIAKSNLGCGINVSSGISWVFEQVDKAIILEDDCVPDLSFFPFCEELLIKYNDHTNIMNICGSNIYYPSTRKNSNSYYFSGYFSTYGWATWKRAWNKFDFSPTTEFTCETIKNFFGKNNIASEYWLYIFHNLRKNIRKSIWDCQWTLSCWSCSGISIKPYVNLVENIGFGADATHTKGDSYVKDVPALSLELPLKHPNKIIIDDDSDRYFEKAAYGYDKNNFKKSLIPYLRMRFKRLLFNY